MRQPESLIGYQIDGLPDEGKYSLDWHLCREGVDRQERLPHSLVLSVFALLLAYRYCDFTVERNHVP